MGVTIIGKYIEALRNFWKIPEGQRFLSFVMLVFLGACTFGYFMFKENKALQSELRSSERQHGIDKVMLVRECDSAKTAIRRESQLENDRRNAAEIEELRKRVHERDAIVEEALRDVRGVISSQTRTRKNLQKAIRQVRQ